MRDFTQYVILNRHRMVPENTTKEAVEFLALSNAFGGEAGELQNIVKKIVRQNTFYTDSDLHHAFVLEAGDALHYLISLIDFAGYSLEYVMNCNMSKLDARKQDQLDEAQKQALLPPITT